MKKIIISCLLLIIIITTIIITIINNNNKEKNNDLTKVTVAEVTHSIFYAPQYLADSLGYFKEAGLDVEITLTSGADAVMSAVLSGEVDIGFCGTEATIYVADKKRKTLNLRANLIQTTKQLNQPTLKLII